MQLRSLRRATALAATLLLTVLFPTCSGGSAGTNTVRQDCAGGGENLFCLTSCNLGCSLSGCSINQIAQNEPVTLYFSQKVDPYTVPPNTASILLRTATGEEPVGEWVVEDNRVTFTPTVRISGASTYYGFRPSETYFLHMPAGASQKDVVKAVSGDALLSPITCPLTIGGIKDLNEAPPEATLITPNGTSSVELDTKIVIEFNEVIDPALFVDITAETSPIRYGVKATQKNANNETVCRTSSEATTLPGVPRMTINPSRGTSVVTFVPQEELPGNRCIEIQITSNVRDLAGVPARAAVLSFTTKDVGVQLKSNVEDFASSQYLDTELSAGSWGSGKLTFSPIGGSGLHGVFDPTFGKDITPPKSPVAIYEWSTDDITIKGERTTTGKDIRVTDGRFFFQTMEIPDGVEVRFVGSNPARIWVRGSVKIGGILSANGETLALGNFTPWQSSGQQPGEKGGVGGCFGGKGGDGADRADGLGTKPAFDGKTGDDLFLPAGHAYYAQRVGTGGAGSPIFPASGLDKDLQWGYVGVIALELNRGGGGGGFISAGGTGSAEWVAPNVGYNKYAATGTTAGGKLMPFPPGFPNYTNGFTRLDHYLVGGSGGGGGGSCSTATIQTASPKIWWRAGRAGGGGGGAMALRVGGKLQLETSGKLQCLGGSGAQDSDYFSVRGLPAPGGGGSGGSLFLQVNLETENRGSISVAGGKGGRSFGNSGDSIFNGARAQAGDGSNGILHFEVSGDPSAYPVGTTVPATPPIAKLDPKDTDDLVTVRSLWYAASLLFPPDFLRYEVHALVDGNPVIYSDDPNVGVLANGVSVPVRFQVQGAKLERDPTGKLNPKPLTAVPPFRDYVGPVDPPALSLFDDGATGYRFELTLDRSFKQSVEIQKVIVFWTR